MSGSSLVPYYTDIEIVNPHRYMYVPVMMMMMMMMVCVAGLGVQPVPHLLHVEGSMESAAEERQWTPPHHTLGHS